MKLGRKPARFDRRTLTLANYLKSTTVPTSCAWDQHVPSWGTMLNTQLGNCTIAAYGHLEQLWSSDNGAAVVIPDAQILSAYIAVTGQEGAAYDPATGANDNGCNELDVLKYLQSTGINGTKIQAFASVNPKNHQHVMAGTFYCGGLYIGLNLPTSAQSQIGKVWDVVKGRSTPWGGHAVPVVRYDAKTLTVVTWGALQVMTWAFWDKFCEESYGLIGNSWLKNGQTPGGINLAMLQQNLKAVTN